MQYYKLELYNQCGETDGTIYEDHQHNKFTTKQQVLDYMRKFNMLTDTDVYSNKLIHLKEGVHYDIVPYQILQSIKGRF